jgi:SagB-type dehydrogenase family enzyme
MAGARRLEASPELRLSSIRAVKRHGGAGILLPAAVALDQPLGEAIARRRSQRTFAGGPIAADVLAALLHAGYGVTGVLDTDGGAAGVPLRAVPSGGALYPLELYVGVLRVGGLEPGLYHFDPLSASLERVRAGLTAEELAPLSAYPGIVTSCAVLILVAAIFGRTRFKYGLRGYRFALLEAGHAAQNVVLAASALRVASVPLGAFYDRRTDAFLGLDGVNESTLYTIAVGRERA